MDCTNGNCLTLILYITNSYAKYYHWGKQSEGYTELSSTFFWQLPVKLYFQIKH